jgi:translation initiation factor 1
MPGLFAGTSLERPVTCEHCGLEHARCTCPRGRDGKIRLPKDQKPRVRREQRRGKTVTVIDGLDLKEPWAGAMLKELRGSLGCGGTVGDAGALELQGDHRDKLVAWLVQRGYPAKAAGG